MNLDQTVAVLERLRDVYGNGLPIGETTADTWAHALAPQSAGDVHQAALNWISTQAKAPRPSDLIDGCRALKRAAVPAIEQPTRVLADPGWPEKVREAQHRSQRDLFELGEAEFLRSRGYDPERYRVSKGMVLCKVREKPKPRPADIGPRA